MSESEDFILSFFNDIYNTILCFIVQYMLDRTLEDQTWYGTVEGEGIHE